MSRWHTSKNPWTRGFAPEGKGRHDAASGGFGFCRRGHKHGNLKEAPIDTARKLAVNRGPHGFTLVEAANTGHVGAAARLSPPVSKDPAELHAPLPTG